MHLCFDLYLQIQYLLCFVQVPSFNRGYWGDFEEFVRTLVVPSERSTKAAAAAGFSTSSSLSPPFKDVYVITGPLFLPSKEAASVADTGSGETTNPQK